jgi:hypothetical protein
VVLVSAAALAAQVPTGNQTPAQAPTLRSQLVVETKPSSDMKVFALEMGTGFLYDIAGKTNSPTQTISALFGFNDAIQAGFSIIKGDGPTHDFQLVRIAAFPVPDFSLNISFGSVNSTTAVLASGFGIGYNVFRNNSSVMNTSMQLNTQYLFNDITAGFLNLGMNLRVGY